MSSWLNRNHYSTQMTTNQRLKIADRSLHGGSYDDCIALTNDVESTQACEGNNL